MYINNQLNFVFKKHYLEEFEEKTTTRIESITFVDYEMGDQNKLKKCVRETSLTDIKKKFFIDKSICK